MAAGFNVIEDEVKIIKQQCRCPKCHKGFLERCVTQINITHFTLGPEKFEHRCNKCGYIIAISGDFYPRYMIKDGEKYAKI